MDLSELNKIEGIEGQQLRAVHFEKGSDVLRIDTDAGTWTLTAYGDCCSESWWEAVEDSGALGRRVTEFEAHPEWTADEASKQEVEKVYGFELKTTHGALCFELRNASNGYYGGDFGAEFEAHS
jgi:hypothetical protein